jgi:ribosome recycling factor
MNPDLKEKTLSEMEKAFEHFKNETGRMRSNRPSAAMIDFIKFKDSYGSETLIKHAASIQVTDSTIVIQPWDTKNIPGIEKAIIDAKIGLNPSTAATSISIQIPKLTMEKINDLIKILHKIAEDNKVSIRNIRKSIKDKINKMKKDSEISEDDEKKFVNELQKYTDEFIDKIDEITQKKEDDLRKV